MQPIGTFSVGITGHRPNRLHIGEAETDRQLYWVLKSLRSGSCGVRRFAVSALAEGADRMFAAHGLDLNFKLHAVLPFKSADYETTFGDSATTPFYRELLERADQRTELPGTLAKSNEGYEAVGHATVDASDLMVGVWDGQGAAGKGGTPEIIDYALKQGKSVIWIHAGILRQPRLIKMPTASGPRDIPMEKLAARAKPIMHQKITKLAEQIITQ